MSPVILLISLNLLFVVNSVYSQTPTFQDFKKWMKEYEKSYEHSEIIDRFGVFLENHRIVEGLNKVHKGQTEFKLNSFADLTPKEFKSKILTKFPKSKKTIELEKNKFFAPLNLTSLPDSFDWRAKGAVTPIKDQGSVGTCWAHSAVENLEGVYQLKGNPLTNLSVEQVVDCDGTFNITTGNADCGVFGGWPYLAFDYIKKVGGIASEKAYPYCSGTKNPCMPCPAPGYNKTLCGPPVPYCKPEDSCQAKLDKSKFVAGLKVADWMRTSEDENDIAAQLMTIGPLSVALNAELLQFYHKGVFDPAFCDPQALDHAVLMVGWGSEKSKPYWTIKNSWGVKWGEDGYFRIARGKGKCGINTQVVSAILE